MQFGEGGAGTFSDGKLTTGTHDPRISTVFRTLVEAGAPADILYQHKPHIGTDVLREVVRRLREELLSLAATCASAISWRGWTSAAGRWPG